MLICPQCNFENPNANKFCQNCGTSLTEKPCHHCGVDVPVNAQECHNCGAFCGVVWSAIIALNPLAENHGGTGSDLSLIAAENPDQEGESSISSPVTLSQEFPVLSTGEFLDPQQRYRLLEPLDCNRLTEGEICVQVLDSQPFQVTFLHALISNPSQEIMDAISQRLKADSPNIPAIAQPYLALQSYSHLGIPAIHDAWQQGNIQVVLIEERSHLPHVLELWQQEQTTMLQIVHYFQQMSQLWEILQPFQCRQSLLFIDNLRFDEDQALSLQRLYFDDYTIPCDSIGDTSPSCHPEDPSLENEFPIQALGRVWHQLFKQSQRTQFGTLMHLLGEMELGNIDSLQEVQSSLKAIAEELQPITPEINTDDDVTEAFTSIGNVPASTLLQSTASPDNENKGDDLPTLVLPMQLSQLDHAGLTDVGRQRDHNEDYFGIDTRISKIELPRTRAIAARGLYILCDGMGGHAGGEVASELAVNTLQKYFQIYWDTPKLPTEAIIRQGIREANQAIFDRNQQDARSGVARMGTTLVMLMLQDNNIAVAHVGDSRLYQYTRKHHLKQITVDHEVGQREISRGVEADIAYARPDAYQLTQALGPRDDNFVEPDVQFFQIQEDTLFILASDGLSDNQLIETHCHTHLEPLLSSSASLEKGAKDLIDLANKYNGHDNITTVLIRAKVRPMVS